MLLSLEGAEKEVSTAADDGGQNDPTASDVDRQKGPPTLGDLPLTTTSQTSPAAVFGPRRQQRHGQHLIALSRGRDRENDTIRGRRGRWGVNLLT